MLARMTSYSINREIIGPMQNATYISGATGFAGSMLSDHLASQGKDLLISASDGLKLHKVEEALLKKYPNIKVKSFICDLSKPDLWKSDISYFKDSHIQNYLNCSGVQGQLGLSTDVSYEEMIRVFNVNLFSSIYFSNFFAKNLEQGEKLSIIHLSGGGATGPRPMFMPYSLSKTSLLRFVENFAAENLNENIRINAVAPGVMPSKMQEEIIRAPGMSKSRDYLVAENALSNGSLDNRKLMELCDFLLSDRSQGITGKLISAEWDNWSEWPDHLVELAASDLYTLRRITGRDREKNWGDL